MKGETVTVYFPCVHASSEGELIQITCFQADELKGTIKTLSGIDETSAANIVGATRHGENNSLAGRGVMATVSNPNFSGRSYGLALAIADKLARYPKCKGINRVFATGRIEPEGCGEVSPIDSLKRKLELVADRIKSGDMFVVPEQLEKENDKDIENYVNQIEKKGAIWHTVSNVHDLNGIVWNEEPDSGLRSKRLTDLDWKKIVPIGLMALIFGLAIYFGLLSSSLDKPVAQEKVLRSDEKDLVRPGSDNDNNIRSDKLKVEPVSVPTNVY